MRFLAATRAWCLARYRQLWPYRGAILSALLGLGLGGLAVYALGLDAWQFILWRLATDYLDYARAWWRL